MSTTGELRQRKGTPDENSNTKKTENENDNDIRQEEVVRSERSTAGGICTFDFAFLLIATICVIFAVQHFDLLSVQRPKLFTKEELATFDGMDGSQLYVGILGEVYDVTKGEKYYGKDKGYYCFVAKDGSRAYVTGKFVDDLTDDVSDFNAEKHGGLTEWRQFYRDHEEYAFVGHVIGAFYDEMGRPTAALSAVEEGSSQAEKIKAQREEAKKINPNCNSRWAQRKGGEVWCKEGYPRLVIEFFPGAEEKKRCACFMETDHSKQKQLYENCAPEATRCIVPPKADEVESTDCQESRQ